MTNSARIEEISTVSPQYRCSECGIEFLYESGGVLGLERHEDSFGNVVPTFCPGCGAKFIFKESKCHSSNSS